MKNLSCLPWLLLAVLALLSFACGETSPPNGAGGAGGDTSAGVGGAGGGGGAAMICEPFSKKPCYTGPSETKNVGECLEGFSLCNAVGTTYGFCEGEVTPEEERCDKSGDEDCDGVSNEGCP